MSLMLLTIIMVGLSDNHYGAALAICSFSIIATMTSP
jgi:hypothetical protein